MGKREAYRDELVPLLDHFFEAKAVKPLVDHLVKKSNLPGPRANLELSDVFVDVAAVRIASDRCMVWNLSDQLCGFTPELAPSNDPKEFLCFCGVRLLGAIGASSPQERQKVLSALSMLAQDPRWRVRESVAMSIQMLIEKHIGIVKKLENWIANGDWLAMRAVAAGVAEPRLMKIRGMPGNALQLHKKIISRIGRAQDRRTEGFKALKKTLGYSLSVVICGVPVAGFDYLRELAGSTDEDIVWIVRENLKKNRLLSGFPNDVRSVNSSLAS